MTASILSAVAACCTILLALWIVRRELSFYRDAGGIRSRFFKYTRQRLIRRVVGAVLLGLLGLLLFIGVTLVPLTDSVRVSDAYWIVVVVVLVALLVVPVLDLYETWKGLRFRSEEEMIMQLLADLEQGATGAGGETGRGGGEEEGEAG